MKADISRWTFDPDNNFRRVLMQQGRAQVDADWNEQVAILLHYLQTLAADLIGPHGGPKGEDFLVVYDDNTKSLLVKAGHYYVNGLLCVNSADQEVPTRRLSSGHYAVYLDVWERHVNAIEDERIREVALGGPDTATRSKVEWQVKTVAIGQDVDCDALDLESLLQEEDCHLSHPAPDRLQARVGSGEVSTDPCAVSPKSAYRGVENQLYRVEIHYGPDPLRFKWSRDNGSVVFPIRQLSAGDGILTLALEHMGHDNRFTLEQGHWVEIITDDYDLNDEKNTLFEVKDVDRLNLEVSLILPNDPDNYELPPLGVDWGTPPFLRRWDHQGSSADGGAIKVEESEFNQWIPLEEGIEIQFVVDMNNENKPAYCPGDYWLIPARTASEGSIEWPKAPDGVKPYRVEHHYAPLAIIQVDGEAVNVVELCRRELMALWEISELLKPSPPPPSPEPGSTPAKQASSRRRKSGSS
jgi:hypothetical protein